MNAAFTKRMRTLPHRTTLLSFAVGTVVLAVTWGIIIGASGNNPDFADAAWWMYLGGTMGAFYVASSVFISPVLGVAVFLVC